MSTAAAEDGRYDPLELLTVREVCGIAKVSQRTVYRWISDGELHAVHLGRQVRVPRAALEDFIRAGAE